MKMKKGVLNSSLTLLIALVAFTVLVFVIPFEGADLVDRSGNFWLSYCFALAAFGAQWYATFVCIKNESAKSRFYGFPLIRVATLYLVVQLLLSLVFMILGNLVPIEIPVVLYIPLLCAAAVGLIQVNAMRETIEKMDEQLKVDVAAMRALQSQTRAIAEQCDDEELRPTLKALAEELQYSDPKSSAAVAPMEAELKELVAELHRSVLDGDTVAARHLCKKASQTLNERNRICKLNK